ncbi:protein hinderin [Latimeria chalumnae]|uniref:KIAA1328 n=1 Tax=Latimeria chalumnae TaxID=7897 RepID=H2ZW09_LATCH|nr:PREDICTED: protein hinderin isoform X2 [Latimeria chalumnae]|eukprot:XP_005990617.1 PREDICTED: protein hinderin isoform X2 [Latimeria chalumnae]
MAEGAVAAGETVYWTRDGVSRKGNLRMGSKVKGHRVEEADTKLPVFASAGSVSFPKNEVEHPATTKQVLTEGGVRTACLKDLCPEDKRRIANLINELARVSEEKEETKERLKSEQESFEKKIRQLEEQNELIVKEREGLQQQYRECQELLKLYQQYLSEQQAKVNYSLSELRTTSPKQQVLNKKSSSTPASLGLDGSYLGLATEKAHYRTDKGSKSRNLGLLTTTYHNGKTELSSIETGSLDERQADRLLLENSFERTHENLSSEVRWLGRHPHGAHRDMDYIGGENGKAYDPEAMSCSHLGPLRREEKSQSRHQQCLGGRLCDRFCNCESLGARPQCEAAELRAGESSHQKRLSEERKQKLLLQKVELEVERERLQQLLVEQEAKLLYKQQQLYQSRLNYNRFKSCTVPKSEEFHDGLLANCRGKVMMTNGTYLHGSLFEPEDHNVSGLQMRRSSNASQSSERKSGSGKKTVGFLSEGGQLLYPEMEVRSAKRGLLSASKRDAATSPALASSRRELVTTATSPIQIDTSRYEASLLELVEAISPVSHTYLGDPHNLVKRSFTPHNGSHWTPAKHLALPFARGGINEDMEESRMLEDIFFI